jgi:hypothetical protein
MSQAEAQTELDTLQGLKSAWENPDMDGTGWTTQKGAKLLSSDLETPMTNVNEIIQSLKPSELKGTSSANQEMLDADNQRMTGKAHDKLWSVYAAGEMRQSFDRVVTDSVRVGSMNRNKYNEYVKELEVYDDKISAEREREFEEKKLEKKKQAERQAEAKKLESKSLSASVQHQKEIKQITQKQQQVSRNEQKRIAQKNHQALRALNKQFSPQNQVAKNNQKTQAKNRDQKKARQA